MKELPILFSPPMVRALLDGSKTQTRRVVKPSLAEREWVEQRASGDFWRCADGDPTCYTGVWETSEYAQQYPILCPYGQPGDRLWVKENYRFTNDLDRYSATQVAQLCLDAGYKSPWAPIHFEADGQRNNWEHTSTPPHKGEPVAGKLRPNIFMPRWASRIDLEITGIRVERLQDISEEDAKAEGIEKTPSGFWSLYGQGEVDGTYSPRTSYRALWESLNGPGSWEANPWLWVIEFKVIKPKQEFDIPAFLRKGSD